MSSKLRSIVGRLLQGYAQRLFRYMGVTVVNTIVGQSVLFIFHAVIGLPGMLANACAVAISTIPAYLLSRNYVWEQPRGDHSVGGEIAPFWMLAFAGLALSTAVVCVVDGIFGGTWSVQIANASAYGTLWIVRFLVIEHLLWGDSANGYSDGPQSDEKLAG